MSIQYHMFKPPFCIVSWFLILKAPLGTFSDSSSGDPGPRPAPVSWRQLGGQLGASPGPVPGNHKHVSRSMSRCWKHDTGHRMETIQQWTWAWDAPSSHVCTLSDENCGTGFSFTQWHSDISNLTLDYAITRQTRQTGASKKPGICV